MKTHYYELKELIDAWNNGCVMLANGKLYKPVVLNRAWGGQRADLHAAIQEYANALNNFNN